MPYSLHHIGHDVHLGRDALEPEALPRGPQRAILQEDGRFDREKGFEREAVGIGEDQWFLLAGWDGVWKGAPFWGVAQPESLPIGVVVIEAETCETVSWGPWGRGWVNWLPRLPLWPALYLSVFPRHFFPQVLLFRDVLFFW
jgi:hypothetical protein